MKESFYNLSKKANTDKVMHHGYHFFYPSFLEKFRNDTFNILEIGYGSGESLKMWCEYFSNSNIFCVDINVEKDINEKCKVIKGDQSKMDDLNKIIEEVQTAKVIVDDGSHNPKHQYDTFVYLFENLLEDGGVYIIEDIETNFWNSNCVLYGYQIGNFDLIGKMYKCQEMINQEFSKVQNSLKISTLTFAQNCIIITKQTKEEQNYFDRKYRFGFLTV